MLHDKKFISIPKGEDPYTITPERAVELIHAKRELDANRLIKAFEGNDEIQVLNGRFGPYVQLGATPEKVKGKKAVTPRRTGLPEGIKPEDVTIELATKLLALPRELGNHPTTGEPVMANTGKFGPYIAHAGDFRSLKGADNPYDVTYERAMEILAEPKSMRKGEKLCKELGVNPKTKKLVNVFESKSGRYLKKGFKRISIPDNIKTEDITLELAVELLGGK